MRNPRSWAGASVKRQRQRHQPQCAFQAPRCQGLSATAAEIVADLAFRLRIRRLHARGPRLIAELLAELAAERLLLTDIEERLDRFLAITDAALNRTGGRELPPLPLHAVR